MQNGIITRTERLEKLKANVKWDKDVLLSWEENVAKDNEHTQLLARYAVEDESKSKVTDLVKYMKHEQYCHLYSVKEKQVERLID